MKKLQIIACVAFAGALLACQKADNPYADAPWAIDETLPVPIQFGSDGVPFYMETKGAPIQSLTNLSAAGNLVQIYGVDEDANSLLFKEGSAISAPARVKSDGSVVFVDENGTDISRYYPMSSSADAARNNYSFVGYRISESTLPGNDHLVRFKISPNWDGSIDRNIDVLYARDDAETIQDDQSNDIPGFNGKYIRQARLNGVLDARRPKLDFTHLTSLAHIYVKAEAGALSGDERYTYLDGTETKPIFTVKNVKIAVKRGQAELNLLTGKISYYSESSPVWSTLFAYDAFADGKADASYGVDVTAGSSAEYGTGFFLLPGLRDAYDSGLKDQPEMQFVLYNNQDGTSKTFKTVLPLPVYTHYEPVYNPATGEMEQEATGDSELRGYVAGRQYNYNIVVKSAVEVVMTATVAGYTNGEFPGGGASTDAFTLD